MDDNKKSYDIQKANDYLRGLINQDTEEPFIYLSDLWTLNKYGENLANVKNQLLDDTLKAYDPQNVFSSHGSEMTSALLMLKRMAESELKKEQRLLKEVFGEEKINGGDAYLWVKRMLNSKLTANNLGMERDDLLRVKWHNTEKTRKVTIGGTTKTIPIQKERTAFILEELTEAIMASKNEIQKLAETKDIEFFMSKLLVDTILKHYTFHNDESLSAEEKWKLLTNGFTDEERRDLMVNWANTFYKGFFSSASPELTEPFGAGFLERIKNSAYNKAKSNAKKNKRSEAEIASLYQEAKNKRFSKKTLQSYLRVSGFTGSYKEFDDLVRGGLVSALVQNGTLSAIRSTGTVRDVNKKNQQIKTDVTLTFLVPKNNDPIGKDDFKKIADATEKDFTEEIKTIAKNAESVFKVYVSTKDYTIKNGYENWFTNSHGQTYYSGEEIAGPAPARTRLKELEKLGFLSDTSADVESLLMLIYNTAIGALFEGADLSRIKSYLANFCVAWMFDDYSTMFKEAVEEKVAEASDISSIHIYSLNMSHDRNVSGYVPLSYILKATANVIEQKYFGKNELFGGRNGKSTRVAEVLFQKKPVNAQEIWEQQNKEDSLEGRFKDLMNSVEKKTTIDIRLRKQATALGLF